MLDFNIEYVRGILFVRLCGNLNIGNTKEVESKLESIINLGGIKYILFNIDDSIIEERVNLFDKCNMLIKNNDGKMYICGLKKRIDYIISSNYDVCEKVKNELSVLKSV